MGMICEHRCDVLAVGPDGVLEVNSCKEIGQLERERIAGRLVEEAQRLDAAAGVERRIRAWPAGLRAHHLVPRKARDVPRAEVLAGDTPDGLEHLVPLVGRPAAVTKARHRGER